MMGQSNHLTVGIIGAGTMGSAIAQKFAQQEFDVILVDISDEFLEKGINSIKATLNEGISRKIFTSSQVEKILSRIKPTTDYSLLAPCNLVIEAVFEDFDVKRNVFQEISRIVSDECLIATNTSSFSVTELAHSVSCPDRFLGMHFFYHAAKNRLIEIIPGEKTSKKTIKRALSIIRRLDKDPIICKDSNGFVVNRFFVPWLNEAVRMNEEGIASKKAIDNIYCQLFGVSMGPFALMNATGVLIAYHSQETLFRAFGPLYEPSRLLKKQAELGQSWSIDSEEKISDNLEKARSVIMERVLGLMFLIWGQLLSEGVCKFGDIHRGAKIGLRWRKTPYQLIKERTRKDVVRLARKIANDWNLELPSPLESDEWDSIWKPDFVLSNKIGKIGYVIINRPEDLNALNPVVVSDLKRSFLHLLQDNEVEIIIITGTGKAFMAGADIKFFIENIETNQFERIHEFTRIGQELLNQIDASSKPIIMYMNGLALGGGLELALAGDVIVASPRAMMGFPETGIGIYPALGGTQRTPARVGKTLAKYLIYSGARITASQALEISLIDQVLTWSEIDSLLDGDVELIEKILEDVKKGKGNDVSVHLGEHWKEIIQFLEQHDVNEILEIARSPEQLEKLSTIQQKLCRQIAVKAPVALKLAEKLINEQKGVESELKDLQFIFKTKDALVGLKSVVTGSLPQFSGE